LNSNVAPICFARGRTTMRPAQFLSCVGLVLLFCAAPLLASGALLLRLGEFEDPDSIGRQLIKYDGLYGTAVNSNVGDVKLSLTAHLKPDVVVLGSSRSLQFRDIMFSSTFVNAGGVMGELRDGINFLKLMKPLRHPKLLILQLDHWWFLDAPLGRAEREISGLNAVTDVTLPKLLQPYHWLQDGSLTLAQAIEGLISRRISPNWGNYYPIGVQAHVLGRGFRMDGSFLDSKLWLGLEENSASLQFGAILGQIHRSVGSFDKTRLPDPKMFAELADLIALAQSSADSLIVVLPSLPRPVIAAMDDSGASRAVTVIRERLHELLQGIEYYDFHEPDSVGGTDCEYLNGNHGGDVTYARILEHIAEQNPTSSLGQFVDLPGLQDLIDRNEGLSFIQNDPSHYLGLEADYLNLNCAKQRSELH